MLLYAHAATARYYLPALSVSVFTVILLSHIVISEQSRTRRFLLYIFARYLEMPILKYSYYLLRGKWKRIGDIPAFRAVFGYLLARPFGYLGDTGKPVPFKEVIRYIDELAGPIAVGPCRCRLGHGACDHPLETDIVFRTGYEAWTRAFPEQYRPISKDEAKEIVTTCHRLNMFHMIFVHCPLNLYNEYVICNCCTCGCVPYIINRELTQFNYPLIDGYFCAVTDSGLCSACGKCVDVCPFDARSLIKGKGVTSGNCFGCGLCESNCPEGAIRMIKLREPLPPGTGHHREPAGFRPRLYRWKGPHREPVD